MDPRMRLLKVTRLFYPPPLPVNFLLSLSLSFFPLSWHVLMARASTRKDRRLPFEALRHRTKERGRLNVAIEINADKKFDDK